MATRFELVLHGDDPVAVRAAGEEALNEIERLEAELSLFRPGSEIAHLNARAAREAVRVTPRLFSLLKRAARLHRESGGAFDITIAPLVKCWGFMGGSGQLPEPEKLAEARAKVGMNLVLFDEAALTIRFAREGVMLDLGAIGKGYAIECAAEVLREAGVMSALLHGGTSTVYGLGHPPGAEAWTVALDSAPAPVRPRQTIVAPAGGEGEEHIWPVPGLNGNESSNRAPSVPVPLRDEALSVSAVWGKSFETGGNTYGHVLDPRNGRPAEVAVLAAVILPSATETDALSTALLIRGKEGHAEIAQLRPGMRTFLAVEESGVILMENTGRLASGG